MRGWRGGWWGSRKTGVSRRSVTAGQETCQWLECKHWAPDFFFFGGGGCICICSLSAINQSTHNWSAALPCISLMKGGLRGQEVRGGRQARLGGRRGAERGPFWDFMFFSSPHSLQIKVAVAKVTRQRKGKYLAVFRLLLRRKPRSQRHR